MSEPLYDNHGRIALTDDPRENLRRLALLLRSPLIDWKWRFQFYDHCGTAGCAIGYANVYWRLGLELNNALNEHRTLYPVFALSEDDFQYLFTDGVLDAESITPEVVAERIDRYLADPEGFMHNR